MAAEFIGTLWLVLGGCGSAVLAAAFPAVGIGLLGVSFAFGLTVLTGAYTFGHISGGHFNPAVTAGLWAGGRFPMNEILPYWAAQVLGAISGAGLLYLIASSSISFDPSALQAIGPLIMRPSPWIGLTTGAMSSRARSDRRPAKGSTSNRPILSPP